MQPLPIAPNITDGWDLPSHNPSFPQDWYLPAALCQTITLPSTPDEIDIDLSDYKEYLRRHPCKDVQAAGYPEHIAKSHSATEPPAIKSKVVRLRPNWEELYDEFHTKDSSENAVSSCSRRYLACELPNGETIYKAIYCGRDWCPKCGKRGSVPHRRRVGRLWHRWLTFKRWGYFVFTVPPSQRPYMNRDVLDKLSTYVKRKFQGEGYKHGFIRWHWAGEDGVTYKPHLNVVIEQGAIGRTRSDFAKKLACYRNDWAKAIARTAGCPFENGQVHFQWTNQTGKAIHWLKYIYRPTYSGSDISVINTINGYRNSRTWGKFAKPTEQSKDEALKHLKGLDIYIQKPLSTQLITQKKFNIVKNAQKLQYIGLGIWKLTVHLPEFSCKLPIPDN